VRTGGKGTVRRKKKAVHKTTTTDDKRLQNTLKRLGMCIFLPYHMSDGVHNVFVDVCAHTMGQQMREK